MNKLSPEQDRVINGKGTEPAFSGELLHEDRTGDFLCAQCGYLLFRSNAKFDSGSGWPSFTEPANIENIELHTDTSHGMIRTEVTCRSCGGHLGHVFDDGPVDKGGQRYCINSLSLGFEPDE